MFLIRTPIHYQERRNEILDVIEKMYHEKGYESCSINDIIKELGIAKGTFYHYFKTKEETLDAIVHRTVDQMVSRVLEIKNHQKMDPITKLMYAFLVMRVDPKHKDVILEPLHQSDNALLHQKQLSEAVNKLSTIIADIVEEGISKKIWSCDYPKEYMRIFLASSLTLTDDGIFKKEDDSDLNTMIAMITLLEKMLNVESGLFLKMYQENFMKDK